jgi:5-methylcytosine-specific restriction endonuclease McrA
MGELEIDHFLPVAQRPELKADYDNLLLVCPVCNVVKGSRALPDPCRVLTSDTVKVDADGTIRGQKREASRFIRGALR